VAGFGVVSPYFFENEDGCAVTVTSTRYVEILQNFLTLELSHCGIELSNIWFQQDDSAAHTVRASMEDVREMFLENVISLYGELPWPVHLPDISACDYFLWGTSKQKCTPVNYGPSMTLRLQFGIKFQQYQKTW
jgi:hypothetical protein